MAKSEKTRSLEESLVKQLAELRNGFSEERVERIISKTHSIGRLKTPEEYKRDRDFALHSLQQVSLPKTITIQWKGMQDEVDCCVLPEYTPNNLAFHLHQFFSDRACQLVQLKHNLQVRWSRFALTEPKTFNQLHTHYQQTIEHILKEYTHCIDKARKFSLAVDLHLAGKPCPLTLINKEEVTMCLRWLTHIFYTTKTITTFITQIQLLPLMTQRQPDAPTYKPPSLTKHQIKWGNLRTSMRRLSQTVSPSHSRLSVGQSPSPVTTSQVSLTESSSALGTIQKTDVPTSALPLIKTDKVTARDNLHSLMMIYSIPGSSNTESSSEQLKLFYLVLGQFRTLFQHQVHAKTLQTYDINTKGSDRRGQGTSILIYRKSSNWLEYIKFRPEPVTLQVTTYIEIKDTVQDIDPLLLLCSECTHIDNQEKVLYALSQHYETVHHPPPITSISVSAHKTGTDPMLLWKCIYTAVDMRNPMNTEQPTTKFSLEEEDDSTQADTRGSIEITDALKLLNVDEGRKISTKADNLPRDAFFAYLLLRHLRIRDIRHKCFCIINYLCSVERTLTLNAVGFSQEPDSTQFNMGISAHLFKTPVDFIIQESEFMQYPEVENHDDFYSFEDMSNVRVWDQNGKAIVYDIVQERLNELEEQLLTIATYYIQKDTLATQSKSSSHSDEVGIAAFSQPKVDRFTILLDLWTCQAQFLEEKIKLINLYLEAYHSSYDKKEKEKLAQVITNLMALQPRLDLQDNYFTKSFQEETSCVKAHYNALKPILQKLLETERSYNKTISGQGEKYFGLPPLVKEKKSISLTGDLKTEINHYLLECFNSLSVTALIPGIVQETLAISVGLGDIHTVPGIVATHIQLWNNVKESWTKMKPLGSDFSDDVQQQFFTSLYIDNPHNVVDLLEFHLKQTASQHENSSPDDKQKNTLQAHCDVIQLITSRYNLVVSCQQTASLYQLHKKQLIQLEQEDSNLFLRHVPFNKSALLPTEKTLDDYVLEARDPKNSSTLDRYIPESIPKAVQELDDQHVGRFSFHTKDDIIRILISKMGLLNLMVTLQTQVATRNALLIVCQQCAAIIRFTAPLVKARKFSDFSQLTSAATEHAEHIRLINLLNDSFISFQKEKRAVRDHMLAQFTTLPSTVEKSQEELEKAKCSLIKSYCNNLITSIANFSLRHQISIVYMKMTTLLKEYPSTRDSFFIIGGVTIPSLAHTSEQTKLTRGRVKAFLSPDGKQLLNLFYVPHISEILTMYQNLPLEEQKDILTMNLQLASCLLNCLMYSSATAKLGQMCDNIGVVATGTESIGGDIYQLQIQMSQLKNPSDPKEVLSYLNLHCTCTILSHDIAVRHYLKRTILTNGDEKMIKTITTICLPGLDRLLTNDRPHPFSHPFLSLPFPLSLSTGSEMTPQRHYWDSYGLGIIGAGPLTDVFSNVYISIAPLNPTGRQAASGELLAMSLLLEDTLFTSDLAHQVKTLQRAPSTISRLSRLSHTFQLTRQSSQWGMGRQNRTQPPSAPLPPIPPIPAYQLLYRFLIVTAQVEQLRDAWGCSLLGVPMIKSQKEVTHLDELYTSRVMMVARRLVARQEAKSMMKMQMENETLGGGSGSLATMLTETDLSWESLEQSESLNEHLLRETQLMRLRDLLGQQFLQDEIRFVNHLLQLSIQEYQRDTDTLPLDLWKKASMKDIPGIPRPHIVEDFLQTLQSGMSTLPGNSVIELPQNHFDKCVNQLCSAVLSRERECYQIYASFYESTIQSLYHQLYLKNQEIESVNSLVQSLTTQSSKESLASVAEYTHGLLLEITALRIKIAQMKMQLEKQEKEVRKQVHKEYQSLVHELHGSSVTMKDKYEQYRHKLYNETIDNLYMTRETVASKIAALQEKLSSTTQAVDEETIANLKATEHKKIQKENALLGNTVSILQSLHQWEKRQTDTASAEQVLSLRKELDNAHCDYLELKMNSEQEIISLKQQVQSLQRSLANEEMKTEVLQKTLEEERHKKVTAHKTGNKDKDKVVSKLERMQDAKIEELELKLEDKEYQLTTLLDQQEKEKKSLEWDKIKTTKALKQTKHQLSHERHLKIDAFHQVEGLIQQVHDFENQQTTKSPSLYSGSLFTIARPLTTSAIRSTTPGIRSEITSTHSLKLQRPKSVQGRLRTATPSEVTSITQEIGGALKLI